MSKWRPRDLNCIYVIPDIHGKLDQLNIILKRILPLRKSDGGQDKLVFLGDYVDRGIDSHLVLDRMIGLKEQYGDQVVFIRGNHEDMFLDALKPSNNSDKYLFWMKYGGEQTLAGYLKRSKLEVDNPYVLPRSRIRDLVPAQHIQFIEKCKNYYEIDNFIFVHGGCDPGKPLEEQDPQEFRWDRSLCVTVNRVFKNLPLPWDKTIITGHNTSVSDPVFRDKFVMLDDSKRDNLLVYEAISGECFIAKKDKKRLIQFGKISV